MSKRLETLKAGLKFLFGAGTMMVIGNLIASTTPAGLGLAAKALTSIGSVGVSGLLADAVGDWSDKQIDEVSEAIEECQKALNEMKTEETTEEAVAEVE